MSAKTKIVVLHMKELIYTLIFAGLGILLIFLLLFMFLPGKEDGESVETMRYVRECTRPRSSLESMRWICR